MTRGGNRLSVRVLAAVAALSLSACSVYDSKMLDAGPAPKTDAGKDAGKDAEMPMSVDASSEDAAGPDTAVACPSDIELCNGVDDDCDDKIDEDEPATADCASKRPHALNIRCLSGTCYSSGCKPGFADLDGRPQNGCEACPGCDDAGVDDSGVP
jgi:hypothetical protein